MAQSFSGVRIGVANRGIPALRIGRTIHQMGAQYVAFYTRADKTAPHVSRAHRAYALPGDNYLSVVEIVAIARANGVRAIHPGWGFAAEDAGFPRLCAENDIVFIGPSEAATRKLGNKVHAIQLARKAGVPVVPGSGGAVTQEQARDVAAHLGYPVMIKSEGGGGGRGIVLVNSPAELDRHFLAAATVAETSFGNPNLFIERFLRNVRHLEIQVLRDHHGNAIALDERDCSLQRKNQKLVEITPSPWPAMTAKLRRGLKDAALALVEAANYDSIATIEFLVEPDGTFYFIEANTRLQVEHGITELIYDIDLVEEMIRIAFGEPLSLRQQDLQPRGCALQCRINFEDPQQDFQPNAGRIVRYIAPGGERVRLDSCVFDGYEFPKAYDSAGALLMTHAATWDRTLAVMERALGEFVVKGPKTTIPFHRRLLATRDVRAGEFDTKFIERTPALMTYRDIEPEHIRLSYLMAEITARGYNPYVALGEYRRFGDSKHGWQPIAFMNARGPGEAGCGERPGSDPAGSRVGSRNGDRAALPDDERAGNREANRAQYAPPFSPFAMKREILEFLRASDRIEFCNTTPRDITQSETSNRLRLYDDRLYGPLLDQCAYVMIENGGGAHYHVNMIGNMTDPWREAGQWNCFAPYTPKMILVRSTNLLGYAPQSRAVMERTVRKIIKHFQVVRCFDFLNHIENMTPLAEIVLAQERNIFAPAISFSWAEGFDAPHYLGVLEEILDLVGRVLGISRAAAAREIILVIKDMAGVAPPRFIRDVVARFKDRYPDLILQYHRHNTDGLAVPAYGAAAQAGARILDVGDGPAVRFFGQPAVLPVAAYLEGELGFKTRLDREKIRETAFVLKQIMPIYDRYVRPVFLGPDHDVVRHGLPGGATSSSQEAALKQGHAFLLPYILVVLELYRKIIRYHDVTPGSQITWTNGYMLAVKAYERGGLDEVRRCIALLRKVSETPEAELTEPERKDRLILYAHANDSLRNLLLGKFGRLPLGWPPDWVYQSAFGDEWRDAIARRTDHSPLENLPPVDVEEVRRDLARHIARPPTEDELVNYLNHPGDALKLIQNLERFGRPNRVPDDIWFEGLELDEEREFESSDGKVHQVKLIFVSRDVDDRGRRMVRYELDHEIFERLVPVAEPREQVSEMEMADPHDPLQVGAPFDADLWIVHKKAGDPVAAGEELFNLSLMKMETAVASPVDGVVKRVLVTANYKVDRRMVPVRKGQLLMELGPVVKGCASCGAELGDAFKFCPHCGAPAV
jgi:pyruvate carboxylase